MTDPIDIALALVGVALDPKATKARLDEIVAKTKEADAKLATIKDLATREQDLNARESRLNERQNALTTREATHAKNVESSNNLHAEVSSALGVREQKVANAEVDHAKRARALDERESQLKDWESRLNTNEALLVQAQRKLEDDQRALSARVAKVNAAVA